MKIAINMITLNCEKEIKRALDSVKGLYDYLVVCDNGSTDSTVKILEKYGAIIVHYKNPSSWTQPFTNNLSHSRNRALEATPEDAHWIVVIDSDEEMIHADILRERLEISDIVRGKIKLNYDHHTAPKDIPYRIRVFSKDDYWWHRSVHQILTQERKEDLPVMDWTDLPTTIKHHQINIQKHHQRYEIHLKEDVEDSMYEGDRGDAITRYVEHVARYGGDTDYALNLVKVYEIGSSFLWGAKIHRRIGNYQKALRLLEMVEEDSNDLYFEFAQVYLKMGNSEKSVQYLKRMKTFF